MLRKKYVVQKSVRLDSKLSEDLEILAKILDRPQNELMNLAIENFMVENKAWFTQNILVDMFQGILEGGEGAGNFKCDEFSIAARMENNKTIFDVKIEERCGHVIEEYTKEFDDLDTDGMEKFLREKAIHVNREGKIMEDYLKHRLDYR